MAYCFEMKTRLADAETPNAEENKSKEREWQWSSEFVTNPISYRKGNSEYSKYGLHAWDDERFH